MSVRNARCNDEDQISQFCVCIQKPVTFYILLFSLLQTKQVSFQTCACILHTMKSHEGKKNYDRKVVFGFCEDE